MRKNSHRSGLLTAFLLLLLALSLTGLGITAWPIAIYAATPFYFIMFVLLFSSRWKDTVDTKPMEELDVVGWF